MRQQDDGSFSGSCGGNVEELFIANMSNITYSIGMRNCTVKDDALVGQRDWRRGESMSGEGCGAEDEGERC